MRERNVYKSIVFSFLFFVLAAACTRQAKAYLKEQQAYRFLIEANEDLTEEIVNKFRKFSGILKFEPTDTVDVTIRLGVYKLETKLFGLDLLEYHLKWKKAEPKAAMGRMPVLFFGEETFGSFTDKNGYAPGKSQIEKWMQEYQEINLTVTDTSGREKQAKICGIIKRPGDKICMDKNQMEEIFGDISHVRGGAMEIYGYQNMKKARSILEAAGFMTDLEK